MLRTFIRDAPSASIARGLRYTTTALLAGLGPEAAARRSVVHWTVDPTALLAALDSGRLPDALPLSTSEMTITA